MKITGSIKKSKSSEFEKELDIERGKIADVGLTQAELSKIPKNFSKTIANMELCNNVTLEKFFLIMNALGWRVEIKVV